ncbi:hypothetical protein E8E12_002971 [Didymella heteroderae]|uniref:Uncharacterized protein n=1 Tax=Didymella heteroderae TaxID=1769908 RepID=A0A9P4X1C8_9PLEO|nr:hypothetical protein E8E12_002971 [Didymella heteroderae]
MLSLHLVTHALAILASSVIAFPARSPSLTPGAAIEQWSISAMELHMMTRHSGIPGGAWPEGSQYPSTIDFDIYMPGQIAHCHTEFANGTLPNNLPACSTEGDIVRFGMEDYTGLGDRRRELSFVLRVWRIHRTLVGQSELAGEVAITANEPSQPTSYLTCLLGPPFDGLRCDLMGVMSNRRDLVIEASSLKTNSTDTSKLLAAS